MGNRGNQNLRRISSSVLHSFKQTISQDPFRKGKVQPQHSPSSLVQVQTLSKLHEAFRGFSQNQDKTNAVPGPAQGSRCRARIQTKTSPEFRTFLSSTVYSFQLRNTLAQTLLNWRTVRNSLVVRGHPVDHQQQQLSMDPVFLRQLWHHLLHSSWQEQRWTPLSGMLFV